MTSMYYICRLGLNDERYGREAGHIFWARIRPKDLHGMASGRT